MALLFLPNSQIRKMTASKMRSASFEGSAYTSSTSISSSEVIVSRLADRGFVTLFMRQLFAGAQLDEISRKIGDYPSSSPVSQIQKPISLARSMSFRI